MNNSKNEQILKEGLGIKYEDLIQEYFYVIYGILYLKINDSEKQGLFVQQISIEKNILPVADKIIEELAKIDGKEALEYFNSLRLKFLEKEIKPETLKKTIFLQTQKLFYWIDEKTLNQNLSYDILKRKIVSLVYDFEVPPLLEAILMPETLAKLQLTNSINQTSTLEFLENYHRRKYLLILGLWLH